ncbi:hypothetical protein [Comamonas testosteroni]|jgi:hypothetical protein|uniref:hypothetical protein n=1 Tax=Comamonas testosteroni TaxID=285 RepID=UPI002E10430E|nr:hypothetical protein U0024_26930 [Comamonas testosteroni]
MVFLLVVDASLYHNKQRNKQRNKQTKLIFVGRCRPVGGESVCWPGWWGLGWPVIVPPGLFCGPCGRFFCAEGRGRFMSSLNSSGEASA